MQRLYILNLIVIESILCIMYNGFNSDVKKIFFRFLRMFLKNFLYCRIWKNKIHIHSIVLTMTIHIMMSHLTHKKQLQELNWIAKAHLKKK